MRDTGFERAVDALCRDLVAIVRRSALASLEALQGPGNAPQPRPSRSRTAPALLPWPRAAEDGTPLGVDLRAKAQDVRLLALAELGRHPAAVRFMRVAQVEDVDVVQEVFAAIARKNRQACAWDPRRGTLGTYVTLVARSTFSNLLEAATRWRRLRPIAGGDNELVDDATPEAFMLAFEAAPGARR